MCKCTMLAALVKALAPSQEEIRCGVTHEYLPIYLKSCDCICLSMEDLNSVLIIVQINNGICSRKRRMLYYLIRKTYSNECDDCSDQ